MDGVALYDPQRGCFRAGNSERLGCSIYSELRTRSICAALHQIPGVLFLGQVSTKSCNLRPKSCNLRPKSCNASDIIRYIEGLVVGQGQGRGESFDVLRWERRFLRGALAEGVAEAGLSLARGNGKTAFCSAIGCAAVDEDGPLIEQGAEVGLVASSKEQASISFRHIKRFLAERLQDKQTYRVFDNAQEKAVENRADDVLLKVLPAAPGALHGLAPKLLLLDEPSQWPRTKVERMFAALRTAAGKIPDNLLLALGTRPEDAEHPFQRGLDGGFDYSYTFEADRELPIGQRRTWKQANPSLDFMPELEDKIRRESLKAKQDPNLIPSFRALRLNQGVADSPQSYVVDPDTWERIEGEAPRQGPCYWGIDLGGSAASSAISGYWPESGRLECVAAFSQSPKLRERALRDGVGQLYELAFQAGELLLLGHFVVDWSALIETALDRLGRPAGLAADTYRFADLREALKKAEGMPLVPLELRRGGYVDGAEDLRIFRRAALAGEVVPWPSLFLTSCFSQARTIRNEGAEKLATSSQGGRHARARDDGAASSLLAVGLGQRRGKRQGRGAYLGAV